MAKIPITMHPGSLTALGEELVTSAAVAFAELVKNAYDANATRVYVRFLHKRTKEAASLAADELRSEGEGDDVEGAFDDLDGPINLIVVEDNGRGMTDDVLREAFCVVGTTYRKTNAFADTKKERRVSGAKGLGRLATARLGEHLRVLTKARAHPAVGMDLDWAKLAQSKNAMSWSAETADVPADQKGGTVLKIRELKELWDPDAVDEVRKELSRLIQPFGARSGQDFEIHVSAPWDAGDDALAPPKVLSNPVYLLQGSVSAAGHLSAKYLGPKGPRSVPKKVLKETGAGPFRFELRVWDLDAVSLRRLSAQLELEQKPKALRESISESDFAGISVYRDGVLVLPKGETRRDWLGLDARRVSRVGERVNSASVMGLIEIGAGENPRLIDTSDRERLVSNAAFKVFQKQLLEVIVELEMQRSQDRTTEKKKRTTPAADLFAELRSDRVVKDVEEALGRNDSDQKVVQHVQKHVERTQRSVELIEERFFYYNRSSAFGTLAAYLNHEVGNHTLSIERFLSKLEASPGIIETLPAKLMRAYEAATTALRSVKRLAHLFAPLASTAGRTRRRNSELERVIELCAEAKEADFKKLGAKVSLPATSTVVAIDPGELTAVVMNLLNNATYWLGQTDGPRVLAIEKRIQGGRVVVKVHDSGPGVPDGEEELIFMPGMTRRPEGMGLGLTLSAELIARVGGKLWLAKPGGRGGATFVFDLPIHTQGQGA